MNVTTSGSIHLFDDVTTAEISEVTAKLHTSDNETIIAEIDLLDPENDSVFSGSIAGLEVDDYVIDLEIVDANVSMEFVRDAIAFTAENLPTTSTTTSSTTTTTVTDPSLTVEMIAIGGVAVFAVVILVVILRRRAGT